jgi:hypothetical protein
MATDDLDDRWDRAEHALEAGAFAEMDEFLKRCEAEGAPPTAEERERQMKLFIEIQQRCIARAQKIYERASSGDPAPHLTVVKDENHGRDDPG